jgi:hypothetical protein
MRKVVVLPQPDGPTSATIFPSGIDNVSLSTAGEALPGKTLVTSLIEIAMLVWTDSRIFRVAEQTYGSMALISLLLCDLRV